MRLSWKLFPRSNGECVVWLQVDGISTRERGAMLHHKNSVPPIFDAAKDAFVNDVVWSGLETTRYCGTVEDARKLVRDLEGTFRVAAAKIRELADADEQRSGGPIEGHIVV